MSGCLLVQRSSHRWRWVRQRPGSVFKKLNGESETNSLHLSQMKQKKGCKALSRNLVGNISGENHLETSCFQMWP